MEFIRCAEASRQSCKAKKRVRLRALGDPGHRRLVPEEQSLARAGRCVALELPHDPGAPIRGLHTTVQVTSSDIVLILCLRAQAGEGLPETFFGSPLKKLDLLPS